MPDTFQPTRPVEGYAEAIVDAACFALSIVLFVTMVMAPRLMPDKPCSHHSKEMKCQMTTKAR